MTMTRRMAGRWHCAVALRYVRWRLCGSASARHGARARHDRERQRLDAERKSRDGATLNVKLADNAPVTHVVKKPLADVKQDIVRRHHGHAATGRHPEGRRNPSFSPRPCAASAKAIGRGTPMPNSTMTNANVETEVSSADGKDLVLKYKDGDKKFIVPANIEVVMFAPGIARPISSRARKSSLPRRKNSRWHARSPRMSASGVSARCGTERAAQFLSERHDDETALAIVWSAVVAAILAAMAALGAGAANHAAARHDRKSRRQYGHGEIRQGRRAQDQPCRQNAGRRRRQGVSWPISRPATSSAAVRCRSPTVRRRRSKFTSLPNRCAAPAKVSAPGTALPTAP